MVAGIPLILPGTIKSLEATTAVCFRPYNNRIMLALDLSQSSCWQAQFSRFFIHTCYTSYLRMPPPRSATKRRVDKATKALTGTRCLVENTDEPNQVQFVHCIPPTTNPSVVSCVQPLKNSFLKKISLLSWSSLSIIGIWSVERWTSTRARISFAVCQKGKSRTIWFATDIRFV